MDVTAERELATMKNESVDAVERRVEHALRYTVESVLLSDLELSTSIMGAPIVEHLHETGRNTLVSGIGSLLTDQAQFALRAFSCIN
mmetsp:Transcript_9872/g.26262  ORF Transcript_9872/g.26262 Transcript_9872/m.26262 type:complete len:87 (-) Transcript_9872:210-470(-)